MLPENCAELLWDYKIEEAEPNFKDLVVKALDGLLSEKEMRELREIIKENYEVVFELGLLTPDKLPTLVLSSPDIAFTVLEVLAATPKKADYYQALFKMQLNRELANFIIKLQDILEIPLEYYESFIYCGIENCMKEKDNDKQENVKKKMIQAKLLSCILLKKLSKNPGFFSLVNRDTFDKVVLVCLGSL